MKESINVFGEALIECSSTPLTGFFRNGCCDTADDDVGSHTVCIIVTREFLEYSASVGNDLSTSIPTIGFIGLKPGNQWCLCAPRWQEALQANAAPKVVLSATHQGALEFIDISDLKRFAIDLN